MKLGFIVAMTPDGLMGDQLKLPWHFPEDLARFRILSLGSPVIMGRHTFASLGRPLPGRLNLVVSRTLSAAPSGVEVFGSFRDACVRAESFGRALVIGGAQLFQEALPSCDFGHVTWVNDSSAKGDVYFPLTQLSLFKSVSKAQSLQESKLTFEEFRALTPATPRV